MPWTSENSFHTDLLLSRGSIERATSEKEMKDPEIIEEASRLLRRSDVAFVFHLAAFVLYARVWMWHTTQAAAVLPGSSGFGWFFRYLTFWSYTLQLLQLALCVLTRLAKSQKQRHALGRAADRLSCATFGIANTVTAMFYAVENTTQGLVEGGAQDRPWWLATAVHALNSGVAWVDLVVVEERSFCGRSRHMALGVAAAYAVWLLVVRWNFGKFPYPVLNKLPFPAGYAAFMAAGVGMVVAAFEVGKYVKLSLEPKAAAAAAARRRRQKKLRAE